MQRIFRSYGAAYRRVSVGTNSATTFKHVRATIANISTVLMFPAVNVRGIVFAAMKPITCARLFFAACMCVFCTLALRSQQDPKEMPQNKGRIEDQNTYRNPALGLTINLPGEWYFFDRTSYSSPEQKQKEKEIEERARATCTGALCGPAEIDVTLRSPIGPMPPIYTVSIGGHKLSGEYLDRERHPLKEFARIMSLGSLGGNWIPEGGLTALQLGGRPAYRLVVHNAHVTTAKGFLYVADSNGHVFMLLGTAMRDGAQLQSALERLTFTNTAP
jgi:hypothetical protein